MPPMPDGADEGILKGIYKFKARRRKAPDGPAAGPPARQRRDPARGAAGAGDPGRALRRRGRRLERHQLQGAAPRRPGGGALEHAPPRPGAAQALRGRAASRGTTRPIIAVSDYMKLVPDQIARWLPGGFYRPGHRRLRPQRDPRGPAPLLRGRRRVRGHRRPARSSPGAARSSAARVRQAIEELGIDPEKPYAAPSDGRVEVGARRI